MTPRITRTKQPGRTKKSKLKQKDATFIYDPQNLRMRTLNFFFCQVSDLVRNAKKRHGKQKQRGTCEVRPSSPIWDFKVKIKLLETPLDLFNFIDLQPRYRNSSISYPSNFEIPVIAVFSRSTEGSGKHAREELVFENLLYLPRLRWERVCKNWRDDNNYLSSSLTWNPHARRTPCSAHARTHARTLTRTHTHKHTHLDSRTRKSFF